MARDLLGRAAHQYLPEGVHASATKNNQISALFAGSMRDRFVGPACEHKAFCIAARGLDHRKVSLKNPAGRIPIGRLQFGDGRHRQRQFRRGGNRRGNLRSALAVR